MAAAKLPMSERLVAITCLLLAAVGLGQTDDLAILSGSVTRKGTAEGISNVVITLTPPSGRSANAITDGQGRFTLRVPAARYTLTAVRQGFISGSGGIGSVSLIAGPRPNNVHVSLEATSGLVGRVLSDSGEPQANVTVLLLRLLYENGRRVLTPCNTNTGRRVVTDKSGEFRFTELPSGAYFLATTRSPCRNQPYYYPGVNDPADAEPVVIRSGIEHVVNLRVSKGDLHSVRFTVSPVPPASVGYLAVVRQSRNKTETLELERIGPLTSRADGSSVIEGLSPGQYDIYFTANPQRSSVAHFAFAIVDRDIDAGTVTIPALASFSGHLSMLPVSSLAPGPSTRTLILRPVEARIANAALPGPLAAVVGEGGSFSFTDIPSGRYRIDSRGLPQDSYIATVRFAGEDITDGILQVNGPSSGELAIMYDGPTGSLEGSVARPDGSPAVWSYVAVIPPAKYRNNPSFYRTGITDQNGMFLIRGVPPGDYGVLAWDEIEPGEYMNEVFLKDFETRMTKVTVERGSGSSVQLRVITASK